MSSGGIRVFLPEDTPTSNPSSEFFSTNGLIVLVLEYENLDRRFVAQWISVGALASVYVNLETSNWLQEELAELAERAAQDLRLSG